MQVIDFSQHPGCHELKNTCLTLVLWGLTIQQEVVDLVKENDFVALFLQSGENRFRARLHFGGSAGEKITRGDSNQGPAQSIRNLLAYSSLPRTWRAVE